jgi:hypothetical protein
MEPGFLEAHAPARPMVAGEFLPTAFSRFILGVYLSVPLRPIGGSRMIRTSIAVATVLAWTASGAAAERLST